MELADIWKIHDELLKSEKNDEPVDNNFLCKCSGYKIINSDGLPTCTSCGVVDDYYIDESPEWTSGVGEDGKVNDPSRCGALNADTDLYSESWGQSTIIGSFSYSSVQVKRMSKINFHMGMNHRDRALFHAYNSIDEAGQGLPTCVLKTAKILYRKFNEQKLTRGAVRTGVKANCIFLACKLENISRTTKEIADRFGIPSKDISRTTHIFKELLNDKKENDEEIKVTRSGDVLMRLLQKFEYTKKDRIRCIKLCAHLDECVELMSKTPNSIASCVIYKIMIDRFSKNEITNICNISIPTLNKIELIINKYLEIKPLKY